MGRGHGRTQAAILNLLDGSYYETHDCPHETSHGDTTAYWYSGPCTFCPEGWVMVGDLAAAVYGTDEPTKTNVESTRRAVRQLEDEGAVETQLNTWDMPTREHRTRLPRRGTWSGYWRVPTTVVSARKRS